MPRLTRSPVARLRLAAGYETAQAAAEALGCSRIYVLEIEAGRSTPANALTSLMAEKYGTTSAELRGALNAVRRDLLERQLEQLDESETPPANLG